jgi:O-antigen/teichoic acid export membrane protein
VPRIDLSIIKGFWRYSTGNYFVSFFAAAPALFLPIIIVHRLDAIQNAYFYIAWMMAGLLSAIPHAVSSSLFAEGSHFEDQLATNARRSFKFILLLLVPSIIFMVAVGKWLLLLFGESYSYHALTLLRILCASSLLMGINNVYYSILRVRGRIRELIVIRALITVSVLVTTYCIAREVGIVGIGYAWVGAHGLTSIYVLLRVRGRYRVTRARQSGG